jgi:DnaJ-domain-containing protein 1
VLAACDVAAQGRPPDARPPTAIERALAGRVCGLPQSNDLDEFEAHNRCVQAQINVLRSDFGYDLSQLKPEQRKSLDSKCGPIQASKRHEVYLDCLAAGLESMGRHGSVGGKPEESSVDGLAAVYPEPVTSPASSPAPWPIGLLLGGGASVVLIAGGVVFYLRRSTSSAPARHACRTCGAGCDSGDLCAACRHEAAVQRKQAAVERAEQERAKQEELRLDQQREEQLRVENARREEALLRGEDPGARPDPAIAVYERRPKVTMAEPPEAQQPIDDEFNPFTVLGVAPGTSPEALRAAYEQALSKYDVSTVAHLGDEVRSHFKAKADAVERAYQMLGHA